MNQETMALGLRFARGGPPHLRQPVRCPSCRQGRICDVPGGVRIANVAEAADQAPAVALYLKCRKCGQIVAITVQ